MPAGRMGAAQMKRRQHRARAHAREELVEKEWVERLRADAANDAEKAEVIRVAIQRRLILRGRLDPHEIPEAVLEQEELLPRLRRHIRTALTLEAQRRVGVDERHELEMDTSETSSYPSWTPLWLHLTWRPTEKPESAALRAAKRLGAATLIQTRYRTFQRRSGDTNGSAKLVNGYMGAPDDPVSGRRMKLLFYVLLLVCWTLASVDSRRPDKYHQTAVIHTHLSISSDLEAPPKSFASPKARRLQTDAKDEIEVALRSEFDPNAPTGGDPQFNEIHTREHLKSYMRTSLRRASVALAQSASPLPFHTVTRIRVRQQRVKPRPCVTSPFDHLSSVLCYPNFHEGEEDKTPFGPDGQWEYTDGSEVRQPPYCLHTPRIAVYPIVRLRTFTLLLPCGQARGYTHASETNGKLGSYDLGGFVLEVFEDDLPARNSTNASGSSGSQAGGRSLKGAKTGKKDLTLAPFPWTNQDAFDMCASRIMRPVSVPCVAELGRSYRSGTQSWLCSD